MKRLLLLLSFVCFFTSLPATTIVIYITPDFVIMAADSKGIYTNASTNQQTNAIVSKIYRSGNIYFSVAGLTLNTARALDIAKITNSKLKNTTNLKTALQEVKVSVKEALLIYLTNQRKNNPSLFKNNIHAEKYITSIGFVTVQNNKPYTHLIGFIVADGEQLKIQTEEEVYTSNTKDAVYYLGTSGEINRYMNTIRTNDLEPVRFVEKLMNLQVSKTPKLVSAPIDIIKITPRETVWIKRKKGTPVELE